MCFFCRRFIQLWEYLLYKTALLTAVGQIQPKHVFFLYYTTLICRAWLLSTLVMWCTGGKDCCLESTFLQVRNLQSSDYFRENLTCLILSFLSFDVWKETALKCPEALILKLKPVLLSTHISSNKWCLSTLFNFLPRLGCLRLRCAGDIPLLFLPNRGPWDPVLIEQKKVMTTSSCPRLLSRLLHWMTLNRCARRRGETRKCKAANVARHCVPFMMILMNSLWT